MSEQMKETKNVELNMSRRTLLKAGAAGGLLAMTPAWASKAFAETGCSELTAAITGFTTINTLDPSQATLIPEFYVLWGVFNSLVKFNEDMEIVPDLAESYEIVSPTVLRFKLRDGIKFHDGHDVTAEDVKFSLERTMDESQGSPHRTKFEAVSEIKVLDRLEIEIVTREPFAPMLSYLTNTRTGSQIVPKHLLENGTPDDFSTSPVGTGAYRVTNMEAGASVTLESFNEYFVADQPKIPKINIPLISEESAGVTALLGGNVDITSTAPFSDVKNLKDDSRVQVLSSPGVNTRFISLNTQAAPFDDVHFRRALSMAFSRQAMVDVVLFGEGKVAKGVIPSSISWASRKTTSDILNMDAEKALEELSKSAYPADTEVKLLTWGSGWWKRFAEVFALQVNQTLGTNISVEVSESGAVYQRKQTGDFQASIWGWLGLIDPDEYAYEILHTNGWRNYGGYSNPEVDSLLEQARREFDQAARGDLYRQAESIMQEDCPVIPCFESNIHNLLAPDVRGFKQVPYSAFGSQFASINDC
ncbi:ABC transporter substrate-binding protein [Halomonas aestuarii]|nr:ABC transporter substrate-binding protein [Halomonas aestuarii]